LRTKDGMVGNCKDQKLERVLSFVHSEMLSSIELKKKFLREGTNTIATVALAIVNCLQHGGKLLLFGNGGSAADAQHIAAEFVGRYQLNRKALPAMALSVNTSTLTAVANDYGYDEIFARQVAAFGSKSDVAIGISTSGNAVSVIRGVAVARSIGILTVGMTGSTGGKLKSAVDFCVCVPSDVTPRIQECHALVGHILSAYCEKIVVSSSFEQENDHRDRAAGVAG
jgi:D-sedoheptulose 7-phosphate isomerase